ncbi:MAG TPA: hypothetical protein EYO32_14870 [Rhodospirillales bacterium]|nr:hypothetical protein [Rhodospirillales bacterium]
MAEGNFRITQFALGDDEVDYGLYNKNHPSGSAYYDLEILQTPVLEAFTKTNANINYGLVSFNGNLNLLYLPTAKVAGSPTIAFGASGASQQFLTSSLFYVSTTPATDTALTTALTTQYFWGPSNKAPMVFIETGISSSSENPPRTKDLTNRTTYIIGNDLMDSNFDVSVDTRFVNGVAGPGVNAATWEGRADNTLNMALSPGPFTTPSTNRIGIDNYKTAIISGVPNRVAADDLDTWKKLSTINGPPAAVTALSISPSPDLRNSAAKYSLYGKVAQDLFGDGNTYDYIDTIVYVVGKTTGVSVQIPFRIVRKRV